MNKSKQKAEQELVDILVELPWTVKVKRVGSLYVASITDYVDIASTGKTEAEAYNNVKKLLEEQLLSYLHDGNEIEMPWIADINLILIPRKLTVSRNNREVIAK